MFTVSYTNSFFLVNNSFFDFDGNQSNLNNYNLYEIIRIMNAIFMIIGCTMLLVRVWLLEYKLKEQLGYRGRYISRFLNYFFWGAMMCSFENTVLNLILVVAFPFMLISLISFDIRFFNDVIKKIDTRIGTVNIGWMTLERITLHTPMVIVGFIWFIPNLHNYIPGPDIYSVIAGIIFAVGSYMLFDHRWVEKEKLGIIIFVGIIFFVLTIVGGLWLTIPPENFVELVFPDIIT
ncbi:MAG: hypothetical protein GY870_20425 [archaeon]|nr:hypothetical protein [archaeon]